MFKKLLSLLAVVALSVGLFVGCGTSKPTLTNAQYSAAVTATSEKISGGQQLLGAGRNIIGVGSAPESDWSGTAQWSNSQQEQTANMMKFITAVLNSDKVTYSGTPILFNINNIDGMGSNVKCWLELNYEDSLVKGSVGIADAVPAYTGAQMIWFEINFDFNTNVLNGYKVMFLYQEDAGSDFSLQAQTYTAEDGYQYLISGTQTYTDSLDMAQQKLALVMGYNFSVFSADLKPEMDWAMGEPISTLTGTTYIAEGQGITYDGDTPSKIKLEFVSATKFLFQQWDGTEWAGSEETGFAGTYTINLTGDFDGTMGDISFSGKLAGSSLTLTMKDNDTTGTYTFTKQ